MKSLELFEQRIGYTFQDKTLLESALTHSSYANEHKSKAKSYERLEFLGDAILGFVTANYLFCKDDEVPEGELTQSRAALVCEKSLCLFSRSLGVGEFARLSYGERHSGGSDRPSILADIFEAVIAAIYIDSGELERASDFILRFVEPAAKKQRKKPIKDYKTTLQELIQQNPEEQLRYVVTGESGPDHDKHFKVEVLLNSNIIGRGGGRSKKEAEQQAAREALELMGY